MVGELARRGCLGTCVGDGDPDLLLAVPDVKVRGVVGEPVLPPRARMVGEAALMPFPEAWLGIEIEVERLGAADDKGVPLRCLS